MPAALRTRAPSAPPSARAPTDPSSCRTSPRSPVPGTPSPNPTWCLTLVPISTLHKLHSVNINPKVATPVRLACVRPQALSPCTPTRRKRLRRDVQPSISAPPGPDRTEARDAARTSSGHVVQSLRSRRARREPELRTEEVSQSMRATTTLPANYQYQATVDLSKSRKAVAGAIVSGIVLLLAVGWLLLQLTEYFRPSALEGTPLHDILTTTPADSGLCCSVSLGDVNP
jgi:hypothetical protein